MTGGIEAASFQREFFYAPRAGEQRRSNQFSQLFPSDLRR
jgi:hypothetical protein